MHHNVFAAGVPVLRGRADVKTAEMAKLSGVAYRTMQDIEQQSSEGSVQTMNRIFGMLGLKLAVARISRESSPGAAGGNDPGAR